jgi:predicted ArsR family transcriptional regulator
MREQLKLFSTEKSFYNTTGDAGKELRKHETTAITQEDRVLEYYRRAIRSTALQASDDLGLHESSARRSVHNLTKKGLLKKTDVQVMGRYGKKNYIFEIV